MALQRGITREDSFREALDQIPSNFNLSWGKGLNKEDFEDTFLGAIFDDLAEAGQLAAGFIDSTNAILEIVSAAVQVTLLNLGIVVDLFEGVLLSLNLLLDTFREAITGISANFLFHFPSTYKSRRTPSELMYDVGMSYLDKQDKNKPVSNLNNSAAVVVAIWSLPNIAKLDEVYQKLKRAIKGLPVTPITESPRYKEGLFLDSKFVSEGTSSKPDWKYGLDLSDIGAFKKLLNGITKLMGQIDTKRSNLSKYNFIIDLVIQRLNKISLIATELSETIEALSTLLSLGDSTGVFVCKGKGDNLDFAKTLINAPLHPTYPSADFLESVDLSQPGNQINADLGRQSLFSGAMAIHLQVVDASEDTFNAIVDLFKKQGSEFGTLQSEPVANAVERFNRIDISSNRNRTEREN